MLAAAYRASNSSSFFPEIGFDDYSEHFDIFDISRPVIEHFKFKQSGPDTFSLTAANAGWTHVRVGLTHPNQWEIAVERSTSRDQDVIDLLVEQFRKEMGWN
jgi:hypothetical protein